MVRHRLSAGVLALAAFLVVTGTAQAAPPNAGQSAKPSGKMYKWVDEHGVTHYGQTIPPEYRDQGAEEMNRRGMTLRRIDPASTPEERRALEEKLEREREEQKRLAEQHRRDRALMNTYGSAEEIDAARDRNLAMPIQALRGLEPRLKRAQTRLASLEAKRDDLIKAGKTPSDYLHEDIEAEKREINGLRNDMDRQSAQIATIRTRYEADRRRFIELTEVAPPR
jgi:chromosome segregation ATPase